MNRAGILTLAALGLGAIAYGLLSRETDEEKILGQLSELALAVSYAEAPNPMFHKAHLNKRLKTIFAPGVAVNIPELGATSSGLEALSGLGVAAARTTSTLDVAFSDVVVGVESEQARMQATVTVTGIRHGDDSGRSTRNVDFTWSKLDGDWLIVGVTVAPQASE